mmetsp:Transcript_23406/g.33422  ORF Transcript_23406/g.33422 Transcript_23406/m.33422 type:complete len:94 (+) Transcript_23406:464-745(+)
MLFSTVDTLYLHGDDFTIASSRCLANASAASRNSSMSFTRWAYFLRVSTDVPVILLHSLVACSKSSFEVMLQPRRSITQYNIKGRYEWLGSAA